MPYTVRDIETPEENSLSIDYSEKAVRLRVVTEEFTDNDYKIIYIPSLQLSSYGKTMEEATHMMWDVVVEDFCTNLIEMAPVKAFEYLSSLGWHAKGAEDFKSSAFVDRDGLLKNFNLPEDTLIEEKVLEF